VTYASWSVEAMSVEELNAMNVEANRPFPRSRQKRFMAEVEQAFPGLDSTIPAVEKIPKQRIARATQSSGVIPPVALIQSSSPSSGTENTEEENPAVKHAMLEKTLQALIQTRTKMLEEQQHKKNAGRDVQVDSKTTGEDRTG